MTITPHKTRKGFTLIQVIAAVAILALVVSIAFAALKNAKRDADNARLRGNAKVLNGAADRARIEGFFDGPGLVGTNEEAALGWYLENDLLVKANQIKIAGLSVNNGIWTIDGSDEVQAPDQDPSLKAPVAPVVTDADYNSISLQLPPLPTGATSLGLQISEDNVRWGTVASGLAGTSLYTVPGLRDETTYYFRATCKFASGVSVSPSVQGTTLTPGQDIPALPGKVTATDIATNSVTLTLPELPARASRFGLQRSLGDGIWTTVATGLAPNSSFTDTRLASATNYQYRAVAMGNVGNRIGDSITVRTAASTGTYPKPPELSLVEVSATSARIRVPELLAGIPYYMVERMLVGGKVGFRKILEKDSGGTLLFDAPLDPSTSYSYRLVGTDFKGVPVGEAGPTLTLTTLADPLPVAPGAPKFGNIGGGSMQVILPPLPLRATSLTLEKLDGLSWTVLGDNLPGEAAVSVDGLNPRTDYKFRVTAVNDRGSRVGPEARQATTADTALAPAAPGQVAFMNTSATGVDILIPPLPLRADTMVLQRKDSTDTLWVDIATVQAAQVFQERGLVSTETYSYRVEARNDYGATAGTPATLKPTILPESPEAVTIGTVTANTVGMTLPGLSIRATSLSVIRYGAGGNDVPVLIGEGLAGGSSLTDSGLKEGTLYTYRTIAVNNYGSASGATAQTTTTSSTSPLPSTPDKPVVEYVSDTSIRLTLPLLPSRATALRVEAQPAGATYADSGTSYQGGASVTLPLSAPPESTDYRVVAVNNSGSVPSAAVTVSAIPKAPAPVKLGTITQNSITITMPGLVLPARSFVLERAPSESGPFIPLASDLGAGDTYQDSDIAQNTTFYYRVVAHNAWANVAGPVTPASTLADSERLPFVPDSPLATEVTTTTVLLQIPDMPFQADQLVLVVLNNGKWNELVRFPSGKTAYLHTGLTPNTSYQYKLLAVNTWGSVEGASATAKTLLHDVPGAPAAPTFEDITFYAATIVVPNIPQDSDSLELQRSNDGGTTWTLIQSGLTTGAKVSDSYLESTKSYAYRAVAIGAGGRKDGAVRVLTTPLDPSLLPKAPEAPTIGTLQPYSVELLLPPFDEQVQEYDVYRTNIAQTGPFLPLATKVSSATYIDRTVTTMGSYYYRLVAKNSYGQSAPGKSVLITTPQDPNTLPLAPEAPKLVGAQFNMVSVSHPNIPTRAASLSMERSADQKTWVTVSEQMSGLSVFRDTDVTSLSTYYYRSVAVNEYGQVPGPSLTVKTPSGASDRPVAPDVVTLSNISASAVTVTLPALSARAVSLSLERSANAGSTWQVIISQVAGGTLHKDTPLVAGSTYLYRAVAYNANGPTPGDPVTLDLTRLPAAPMAPTISDVATTTLTVTASSLPARATSLNLERSANGGTTWTMVQSNISAGAAYYDSGLTAGTTYRYRMVAMNDLGATPGASAPVILGVAGTFTYSSGGDQNGVFYYLGTNGGATTFSSPFISGRLGITATNTGNGGYMGDLVDRRYSDPVAKGYNVYSIAPAAITYDLGAGRKLVLKQYAMHNPATKSADMDVPLKWDVSGSNDGKTFTAIHTMSTTNNAVNAWNVYASNSTTAYRYIRFAFPYSYRYACIEEMELYGDLVDTSAPQAPGTVTFSNVTQNGATITMPPIPPGASSLDLQNAPDGATWTTVQTGTTGGAVLNFTGSPTSLFRAVAVNTFGTTAGPASTPQAETVPTGDGAINDNSGIFYQLGTQFGTQEWQNPVYAGYLAITMSTSNGSPTANLVDLGADDQDGTGTVATTNVPDGYIQFDLKQGNTAVVSKYIVRAAVTKTGFVNQPSLGLLGSNDGVSWTILDQHSGLTFTSGSSQALICNQTAAEQAYRYFRISLMGMNGAGTHILSLSEVEFYGSLSRSQATTTAPAAPSAPTLSDLKATAVTVMTPMIAPGATSMSIERSQDKLNWTTVQADAAPSSGYPNTGLVAGQTYYYRIVASNMYGSTPGASVSFSPSNVVDRSLSAGGDQNGVFYYLGTAKGTALWTNPILSGEVQAQPSSVFQGTPDQLTDRVNNSVPFHTKPFESSFVQFDLGRGNLLEATAFTYKTRTDGSAGVPASISVYGSSNGSSWRLLKTQAGLAGGNGTWNTITLPAGGGAYRYFRASMNGPATDGLYYFGADEMEFYGKLITPNVLALPGSPVLSNQAPTSVTVTTPATLSKGAASYAIERSTDLSTWTAIASELGANVAINETGLTAGVTYYYRMVAVATDGQTKAGPAVSTAKTTSVDYTAGANTAGIFNYIGTNGLTAAYVNPYSAGQIGVTASSIASGGGAPVNLFDRASNQLCTNDVANGWVTFDLGASRSLKLTGYVLRARNTATHLPVRFKMEGSMDNATWTTLDTQSNVTWTAAGQYKNFPASGNGSYRYFRITQTGLNSNGANYFTLDDPELYGELTTAGQSSLTVELSHDSDGDKNGLFYYLGTNGLTSGFTNPSTSGKIVTTASSTLSSGQVAVVTDRVYNEFFTNNTVDSWVRYDLGVSRTLKLQAYSIRLRSGSAYYSPSNFVIEGSANGTTWTVLDTRTNVSWQAIPGTWKTFTISSPAGSYRYIRIRQNGLDSSSLDYLCFGEMELYGTLTQ